MCNFIQTSENPIFLNALGYEISLDDDNFDDEIITYPLYLKVAKEESYQKDLKAKEFYNSCIYESKETGKLFRLDFDSILKSRASLMQNSTSSFARVMKDQNRIMCFKTVTLIPSDRLANNLNVPYEETLKAQYQIFKNYNNHIRHDKNNRNRRYFRVFELHKKGDLHQHNMDFTCDTLSDILDYIDIEKRAKKHKDIGRIELRLPYKYKQDVIKKLGLLGKNNVYYEDYESFKTGSALIISFFQPDKESAKDIVAYMLKYTAKSTAYSKHKSNEYYVFRKLGIRVFFYSLGVIPSVTAYQKVRSALIQKNKRYEDLYELQKDIDKNLVTFSTHYEKKDPEYIERCIEKISNIDKSNDYPIIHTYNSYEDICVFKGCCQLVAVSVSFFDGTDSVTWHTGKNKLFEIQPKIDPRYEAFRQRNFI